MVWLKVVNSGGIEGSSRVAIHGDSSSMIVLFVGIRFFNSRIEDRYWMFMYMLKFGNKNLLGSFGVPVIRFFKPMVLNVYDGLDFE